MQDKKSTLGVDPRLGLVLAFAGVAVVWLTLGIGNGDSASTPTRSADSTSGQSGRSHTLPVRRLSSDQNRRADAPNPLDLTPHVAARAPAEDEQTRNRRVDLACRVEPALPASKAIVRHISWPGQGRYEMPAPDEGDSPLRFQAPTHRLTIRAGVLEGSFHTPSIEAEGMHIKHEAELLVPGFEPTRFSYLAPGSSGPGLCVPDPVRLEPGGRGVVGEVTRLDGTPVAGAVVEGCGSRAQADEDGSYFLVPVDDGDCALTARLAWGAIRRSAPKTVQHEVGTDQILDFALEPADQPSTGVMLYRSDKNEIWGKAMEADGPWHGVMGNPSVILRVGETLASELSDEEILKALLLLEQPIQVQHRFETADGEELRVNLSIDEV